MKILFVHQNFPGQFPHLSEEMARLGHEVMALTAEQNQRPAKIAVARYKYGQEKAGEAVGKIGANHYERAEQGLAAARGAMALKSQTGFTPDVIIGNIGWGETLYLRDVWPAARMLAYGEFCYHSRGYDTDFDPEFQPQSTSAQIMVTSRRSHLVQAMADADAAIVPTHWQASTFPQCFRSMITVVHDGVDTAVLKPDPTAHLVLPGTNQLLRQGDEILTYVSRNLDPYRGFHVFLRSLPAVLKARPNARVVIVGGDDRGYGKAPPGGGRWRDYILAQMPGQIDLTRVHFTGRIPYDAFVRLLQITRVHAYLTYPFVLSWSMIEAMAAGALVIGSRTAPIMEVIEDGVNGRLVDFFDIAGWSAAFVEALANPDRALALRQAARQTALDRYDLRRICLPRQVTFMETAGL